MPTSWLASVSTAMLYSRVMWGSNEKGHRRCGGLLLVAPDYLAFTASFRALPGRNFGTRAFLILISSPVRGLRPVRAARSDTAKVPKPTRVTEPFFFRVVLTAPTKASRARPTSALERSVLEEMCSISSVLFIDEIPLRFIVVGRTIRPTV